MQKGQKVVCINDTFPGWVKVLYKHLPVKGKTYTIREVFLGRGRLKGGDGEVGLLLVELVNPPDPTHAGKEELGFNSERFAPLQSNEETIEAEMEKALTV